MSFQTVSSSSFPLVGSTSILQTTATAFCLLYSWLAGQPRIYSLSANSARPNVTTERDLRRALRSEPQLEKTDTLDPEKSSAPDTREGLYFGLEVDPASEIATWPLHGPNQWPDPQLLPDYRPTVEAYYQAMRDLGDRILRLLALALEMNPTHFEQYFTRPMAFLRPLRYGPQLSQPDEGKFGAGAHSDWGMVTILAVQDPGLQIWKGGTWVDVKPVDGTFVVNLGDMLERWSNGLFKATVHRVVSVTGKERFSVPFFLDPNFDALVECLPTCVGDTGPRYPPTTAGQHLLDKYAQTRKDGLDVQQTVESQA